MPIEIRSNGATPPKDMIVKKLYQLVNTHDVFYLNHVLMLVERNFLEKGVIEKEVLLIDLTEGKAYNPDHYFEEDEEALVRLLDHRDTLTIY